jgi:hypothetical protein
MREAKKQQEHTSKTDLQDPLPCRKQYCENYVLRVLHQLFKILFYRQNEHRIVTTYLLTHTKDCGRLRLLKSTIAKPQKHPSLKQVSTGMKVHRTRQTPMKEKMTAILCKHCTHHTQKIPGICLGSVFDTDKDLFWQLLPNLTFKHSSSNISHPTLTPISPALKPRHTLTSNAQHKSHTQRTIDSFFQKRSIRRTENPEEHSTWGDHISPSKLGLFRIAFNNVNGISPRDKFAKAHIIGSSADTLEIDLLGMAETNVLWTFQDVRQQCTSVLRNYWKQSKQCTSSSALGFGKIYQPGGTMSIIGNKWASRSKLTQDSSQLGRWTECEIQGKNEKRVTFITAYNVCSDNIATCGPTTAFAQQYHLLKLEHPGRVPDPRQVFWDDLKYRIAYLQRSGHEVVVMMDANDTLQNPQSKLTSWVQSLNLTDIHMHYHGTEDEPATYSRGSTRIDYMFATSTIKDYIEYCGILPTHELCLSDHRALFADIDLTAYLGNSPPNSFSPSQRGVLSSDPRTIYRYQKEMEQALDKSDIENQLKLIQQRIASLREGDTIPDDIHSSLEAIDIEFLAMRLTSEENSKSKHNLPWSPILKSAFHDKQFWCLWISQLKSKNLRNYSNIREKYITNNTKNIAQRSDVTLKEATFHFKKALQQLNTVKLQAQELREKFLEERAKLAQDDGDVDLAHIIKAIQRAEARKRIFTKLKRIKGKTINSGLDHIITTDIQGNNIPIYDPEKMFSAIIERNIQHFSQADGTPFTIEPLKSLLGPYATSEFAQSILLGEVDILSLPVSEATKAILLHLKKSPSHETINVDISTEDVINGYMKWGEFTSTSPSGAHLGHDKAMLKRLRTQDNEALLAGKMPIYRRFFEIKAILMDSSIKIGHVYERWKKVVNALIEKIPGMPMIGKLRVIHLIESDFNLIIGMLWGRRMIWEAEDKQMLNDGQGGSRPGRRAQEQVVQKHSIYSILRMSQTNGSSFDNDAKSCYDRIVMPLASLCSQQIGMPANSCELFLKTLKSMRYHVKTKYGISEESYTSTQHRNIHGPGQGGRGSPAVWVAISSILMKCMEDQLFGAYMKSPFPKHKSVQFWLTGFVDDVTHWCIDRDRQTENKLCKDLQDAAQWWEQLLHASGGKLELSKCFFYIMQWRFDPEGRPYLLPPNKFQHSVHIVDSETGTRFDIPQRDCSQPHKTLGVMETPDGNNKAEIERLSKLSDTHGQRCATGQLTREEAELYYNTTYLTSMSYGLVIGTLTANQWQKVQSKARQTMLSAMGYNKCSPLQIVHGPTKLGGYGLQDLYNRQETEKITFALRLLRSDRDAGATMQLQFEWAQQISGISSPLFEACDTRLPQLVNERWIQTTRTFLLESKLSLVIPKLRKDLRQRVHDRYIMDIATTIPKITDGKLIKINRCRIFLRATTISDITNAMGDLVDQSVFECTDSGRGTDAAQWPRQARPGPSHRAIWKKFIRWICEENSLTLLLPLGKWLSHTARHRRGTKVWIDTPQRQLFFRHNKQWFCDEIDEKRSYSYFRDNPTPIDPPDFKSLLPVDVSIRDDRYQIKWSDAISNLRSDHSDHPANWEEHVALLDIWRFALLQYHNLHIECEEIIDLLCDPAATIICVSDGSNTTALDFGTFAWLIHDPSTHGTMITGTGFVPGYPVSSFRAECFGKLAWLVMLNEFCSFHKIRRRCAILSYCDNETVTKRTKIGMTHLHLAHTLAPSYDVLREIHLQQDLLQLDSDTRHVKGHQDRVKKNEQLTLPETLNIEADSMASEANTYFCKARGSQVQYDLPNGGPYLKVDKKAMWSGEIDILRWRRSEFALQQYYVDTFPLPNVASLNIINWAGFRLARQALSPGLLLFSSKFNIDWLPTGKQMHRRGNLVTECVLCGEEESNIHLFLCPSRLDEMNTTIIQFSTYLSEIDTEPELRNVILGQLATWMVLPSAHNFNRAPITDAYSQAVTSQNIIGWHRFVKGYLAVNWAQIQDRFLEQKHSPKLGDSWSAKVSLWWIKKSHEIWMDRNDIVHSKLPGIQSRLEEETLAQVQRLYDQQDLLPAADREMLDMSLEQRLQQPIQSLRRWLEITSPTVHRCILLFREVLQAQHQTITSFFPWRDVRNRDDTQNLQLQTQHNSSSAFLRWRDVRRRESDSINTNSFHEQHQCEATPGELLYNNSQESLSSCRK